ncbi:UDP-N-acetylmuramoylalanine-D-glutamate ligase [Eggerthia catenaformis OT 569 = DSM 20559]|uniref:UDP-N-acetylmuramoylalanine--D-glutamate ligase n=1 Tax=Eggerthia catenaformis OT 569 = DSM 20559 TaxID=999415 RepID=M2Q1P8_9FIRM|nr:UDP-N-acetylmuramoyl-L-alanine--D-glutamate ligase [Eggerthia catenaformis]EMD16206.1 UDP-N-acetylmuramoylalanine-D-glutamate ligase [Eggerthia catenaformis OT 569 = DSM 20559]
MELKDKKVLVLGLARSGKAAVRLLQHFGAKITINESKEASLIEDYENYISQGIEVVSGGQPEELFDRDFDFVIKNPGINYHAPFILKLKQRGIPVYTEIELAYQMALPQNYIAVTGTNGKTTTVSLIYEVLKRHHSAVHICGNYGIPYCDVVLDYKLYENSGHDVVVEMSNFQLIDIDLFHPHVSSVLNLTPDHLDYMDSLDEYYASKMRIYENTDLQDIYALNLDDFTLQEYLKRYPVPCSVETFSVLHHADCELINDIIYYKGEPVIARSDIKIVGLHNVSNIMVSIIALRHAGLSLQDIKEGISLFHGVEHRLEFVREVKGVQYYNDSKGTNTDAAVIAIKAFDHSVILLMGGHEKGLDIRDVAQYNDRIKILITFGESGERFAKDMNHPHTYICEHMREAVIKASQLAIEGDIVLLSPSTSSFDEFKNMAERGNVFKEMVKQL